MKTCAGDRNSLVYKVGSQSAACEQSQCLARTRRPKVISRSPSGLWRTMGAMWPSKLAESGSNADLLLCETRKKVSDRPSPRIQVPPCGVRRRAALSRASLRQRPIRLGRADVGGWGNGRQPRAKAGGISPNRRSAHHLVRHAGISLSPAATDLDMLTEVPSNPRVLVVGSLDDRRCWHAREHDRLVALDARPKPRSGMPTRA